MSFNNETDNSISAHSFGSVYKESATFGISRVISSCPYFEWKENRKWSSKNFHCNDYQDKII
ncbi:hypothetical protein [Spiroplasma endosymbiont of Labia minor]|uniref:hypothetical protein n=1 Tax=Spiroplasma endosymbiont of Labia minor TaxID=3066305 RepID=UPI0030CA95AB